MEFNAKNYKPCEIVKFIREATGKTQNEFAQSLGKSSNWLKAIEQDINKIYFDDILKIAKLYNIDLIIKEQKKQ